VRGIAGLLAGIVPRTTRHLRGVLICRTVRIDRCSVPTGTINMTDTIILSTLSPFIHSLSTHYPLQSVVIDASIMQENPSFTVVLTYLLIEIVSFEWIIV
jgi:hypothetical protein